MPMYSNYFKLKAVKRGLTIGFKAASRQYNLGNSTVGRWYKVFIATGITFDRLPKYSKSSVQESTGIKHETQSIKQEKSFEERLLESRAAASVFAKKKPEETKTKRDDTEEMVYWEVESIVRGRYWFPKEGSLYLFVKWENYDSKSNTWEPIEHLIEDCPVLVNHYMKSLGAGNKRTSKVLQAIKEAKRKTKHTDTDQSGHTGTTENNKKSLTKKSSPEIGKPLSKGDGVVLPSCVVKVEQEVTGGPSTSQQSFPIAHDVTLDADSGFRTNEMMFESGLALPCHLVKKISRFVVEGQVTRCLPASFFETNPEAAVTIVDVHDLPEAGTAAYYVRVGSDEDIKLVFHEVAVLHMVKQLNAYLLQEVTNDTADLKTEN